jgi:hypothetical protein
MRRFLVATAPLLALLLSACASKPPPCPCTQSPAGASAAPLRSPKLEALAAQRVELARKRLVLLRASFGKGTATLDELFAACRDVAFAARDSGLRGVPLRDVLKDYRDAVISLKELTRERLAKGAVDEQAMSRVEVLAAEAEYWLEEASPGGP